VKLLHALSTLSPALFRAQTQAKIPAPSGTPDSVNEVTLVVKLVMPVAE